MYEIVIFFKVKILSAVAFFGSFFATKEMNKHPILYLLFFHEQEK